MYLFALAHKRNTTKLSAPDTSLVTGEPMIMWKSTYSSRPPPFPRRPALDRRRWQPFWNRLSLLNLKLSRLSGLSSAVVSLETGFGKTSFDKTTAERRLTNDELGAREEQPSSHQSACQPPWKQACYPILLATFERMGPMAVLDWLQQSTRSLSSQ